MQLELEVSSAEDVGFLSLARKTFDGAGGVIGRGAGCDWVIADSSRLLSSHHGLIACREGRYFLTDISSNGIGVVGSDEILQKGQARLVNDGDKFRLGALVICARLIEPARSYAPPGQAATDSIPDDAFLALDPVQTLDRKQKNQSASQVLESLGEASPEPEHHRGHTAVDRERVAIPRRAEPVREAHSTQSVVTPPTDELFWKQFSAALGMDHEHVDALGREALAIKVARLLRLEIEGLQQSVRTCEALKSELNLPRFDTPLKSRSPLKDCPDTDSALAAMLGADNPGQLSAEQAVTQVHRELHVHQVALLAACRSALRTTRTAFAPGHLLTCFHHEETRPRFSSDGGHWRAYQRHYQRLMAALPDDGHLPEGDFTKVYAEQVRLISTLHADYRG